MKISKLKYLFSYRKNKQLYTYKNKINHWLDHPSTKKAAAFSSFNFYNNAISWATWLKKKYSTKFYLNYSLDSTTNAKRVKLISESQGIRFLARNLFFFLSLYRTFFFNYKRDLIFFLLINKKKNHLFFFFFYWNFTENQRLFLNFKNLKKKTFLFLSNGMFLKYFEKKKSLKKKKILKILLARYLRKMLLIVRFKNTISIIKKTPSFFLEMFNVMNSMIIHKFLNPFSKKIMIDNDPKKNVLRSSFFIFYKNIDFAKNKKKKKRSNKTKNHKKDFFK